MQWTGKALILTDPCCKNLDCYPAVKPVELENWAEFHDKQLLSFYSPNMSADSRGTTLRADTYTFSQGYLSCEPLKCVLAHGLLVKHGMNSLLLGTWSCEINQRGGEGCGATHATKCSYASTRYCNRVLLIPNSIPEMLHLARGFVCPNLLGNV